MPRVVKSKNVLDDDEVLGRCREIARVFTTMERWLREENLGTFSHMITRAHALLHSDETVLAAAQPAPGSFLPMNFRTPTSRRLRSLLASPGADGNIFCCRRSRPGHLPFSRGIERGLRSCSIDISPTPNASCSKRIAVPPLRFSAARSR